MLVFWAPIPTEITLLSKEPIRSEFFSNIEEAINNHGGAIKSRDTLELQLSTKDVSPREGSKRLPF